MDCRIDPLGLLGLEPGDAHVLRNAGGVVTDDVIRSLAISQRSLGTTAVRLIHHTDCGMLTLTDDSFRAQLRRETGMAPPFAIESFADIEDDVRESILRVTSSPFVLHRDDVRGFVYDVEEQQLREVGA
jgi:carbonic anhydrase